MLGVSTRASKTEGMGEKEREKERERVKGSEKMKTGKEKNEEIRV